MLRRPEREMSSVYVNGLFEDPPDSLSQEELVEFYKQQARQMAQLLAQKESPKTEPKATTLQQRSPSTDDINLNIETSGNNRSHQLDIRSSSSVLDDETMSVQSDATSYAPEETCNVFLFLLYFLNAITCSG